jgi:hypothetical protein
MTLKVVTRGTSTDHIEGKDTVSRVKCIRYIKLDGHVRIPLSFEDVSIILILTKESIYKWVSAYNCSPGQTFKKPKYLSACDREECGCGEGAVTSVCMCERVVQGRSGGCRLVRAISAVIYT